MYGLICDNCEHIIPPSKNYYHIKLEHCGEMDTTVQQIHLCLECARKLEIENKSSRLFYLLKIKRGKK